MQAEQEKDAKKWYLRACEHDSADREVDARTCYQNVYELGYQNLEAKEQPSFFLGFGSTLRNVKEPQRSIEILQEGVALFPNHSALKAFLALSLYSEGKFQGAAKELFQCLLPIGDQESLKSYSKALSWYVENLDTHPYPPLIQNFNTRPRVVALAMIKREDGKLLLSTGYDSVKRERFYRLLGGGIDFGETGAEALEREFIEELNKPIVVDVLVDTIENIFTYEGKSGHEIIFVYKAKFKNLIDSSFEDLDIVENGRPIGKAVWRSLDEVNSENAKLYPEKIRTF